MIRKLLLSTSLFLISFFAFSQDSARPVDMADTFRSNGKIYVVVAVILTIFAGLIIYLIRLDRKLNKLEKENP
jgi:hypothetical protein